MSNIKEFKHRAIGIIYDNLEEVKMCIMTEDRNTRDDNNIFFKHLLKESKVLDIHPQEVVRIIKSIFSVIKISESRKEKLRNIYE